MIVLSQRFREIDPRWVAGLATAAAALWIGQTAAASPMLVLGLVPLAVFVFIAQRWPWAGLCIYVGTLVVIPAYIGVVVGPFGAWTPTRVLGVLYIAVLVARKGLGATRWNAVDIAFCVFLLLSVVFLPLKGTGITATVKTGLYTALDYGVPYLAMRVASSDIGQVRRLLGMVTFWAVVIGALAMAEVALNYNPFFDLGPQLPSEELWTTVLYRGGGQRATASFSHPISLGMFAALLLPVAFWLAQHARSRSRTLLIGGGGLVIAAMLFATLSRGPWIGAFAALGIGLMIRPRRPRGGRAALALAICGLVALYLSGISPLTTIINDSFDPSTMDFSNFEYRQGLVPFVLDLWSRSPIFGYSDLSIAATSVDNYYLVLLLMSGAVGFLAFVGLMAVLVSRLLNVMRLRVASHDLGSDLAAMLLGAFIGQLLILGSVAMVGSAPYFFWGFAGLAAGAWATRTQQPAA